MDHFISKGHIHGGADGSNVGLVIIDRGTKYKACYPKATKANIHTKAGMKHFVGPNRKPKLTYSDNAPEYISSLTEENWTFDTATTGRSESNGVAERAVEDVKQGTTSSLLQGGMFPEHWPTASEHYCHSNNITPDENGVTPWALHHTLGDFPGLHIPYCAKIYFYPVPAKAKALPRHQENAIPGLFVGWKLGSGGKWNGEYIVFDYSKIDKFNFKRTQ
jgi:hypothetical protein